MARTPSPHLRGLRRRKRLSAPKGITETLTLLTFENEWVCCCQTRHCSIREPSERKGPLYDQIPDLKTTTRFGRLGHGPGLITNNPKSGDWRAGL
ncbi:hypothetical protein EVAR_48575_1 [Eumeta japonica]|uniref:Uncharacterized protein n=1 Tax=Eumeta variegata TaxID=151549 RepID=A0A4C1XB69_EUMVA|nr:hypothetical protein EVAR_48575_1 [Eumeta japonica]